jgi:phosphoglycolate phosphatase
MGLEPQQILFVGDSDNDIWTAQAAGMVPLGVSWGYGRLMHRPVHGMGRLAGKPSEIIDLLNLDGYK